jgi:low affinity Fe/Cu permease
MYFILVPIIGFVIFKLSPIALVLIIIITLFWFIFPKVKQIMKKIFEIIVGLACITFLLWIFLSKESQTEPLPIEDKKENKITPSDFASLNCLRRSVFWCAIDVLTD